MVQSNENMDEKWDQILYENANKSHIHQDNLRWTLSGGFAAFFYGSIVLLHHEQIIIDVNLVHKLHLLFCVLGTLYWIALCVEGWYYNFYLKYLIECEEKIILGEKLTPIIKFNRRSVKMFHPSFTPILILVVIANSYHLYCFKHNIILAITYNILGIIIAIKGHVFKHVDVTKSNNIQ